MGILDELRQQAQVAQAGKDQLAARQRAQQEHYLKHTRPRIEALLRYLQEVAEHIRTAEVSIPVILTLPVIGAQELLQRGFVVQLDNAQQPRLITLNLELTAEHSGIYPVASTARADEFRAFLDRHRVRYTEWAIRDASNRVCGANFECQLTVRAQLRFEVQVERDQILMHSINFEQIGINRHRFASSALDEQWLDRLGHYLLRRDTRLAELEIAEHQRENIRSQLTDWQQQRQRELDAAASGSDDLDGLFDQLRKSLNRPLW